MSDNEERKKYAQRYRRRDLSNGGKQEPGDTLIMMNKRHISIVVIITANENRQDSTCVKSRRLKPNIAP